MINLKQSVAILVDGNNIGLSISTQLGKKYLLNYETIVPKIVGEKRQLNRLFFFREGKNISKTFSSRLHSMFYGTTISCHKSADIPLTIKAIQLSDKVDTIIIMSGDADYVDLVKHLKNQGVRVEICSIMETTSKTLLRASDFHYPITETDCFAINKGF